MKYSYPQLLKLEQELAARSEAEGWTQEQWLEVFAKLRAIRQATADDKQQRYEDLMTSVSLFTRLATTTVNVKNLQRIFERNRRT
jgi:hypothetical protein